MTNPLKAVLVVAAALGLMAGLTACAGADNGSSAAVDSTSAGSVEGSELLVLPSVGENEILTADLISAGKLSDTSPQAEWLTPGSSLSVTVWGGVGCTSKPVSIKATAPDRVEVHLSDKEFDDICLASYGPHSFDIALPAEVNEDPLTVTIIHDEDVLFWESTLS